MQEVGINGDRQRVCQCVTAMLSDAVYVQSTTFQREKEYFKQTVLITYHVDLEELAF